MPGPYGVLFPLTPHSPCLLYTSFLTADHGNAEKMKNPDGSPFTAHTTNVVPFAVIGAGDVKLREGGCLADIAPTMLCLLYTSRCV